ncbi:hypothetical protein PSAC2689_140139 [Paraburkholderia sacchari]
MKYDSFTASHDFAPRSSRGIHTEFTPEFTQTSGQGRSAENQAAYASGRRTHHPPPAWRS